MFLKKTLFITIIKRGISFSYFFCCFFFDTSLSTSVDAYDGLFAKTTETNRPPVGYNDWRNVFITSISRTLYLFTPNVYYCNYYCCAYLRGLPDTVRIIVVVLSLQIAREHGVQHRVKHPTPNTT